MEANKKREALAEGTYVMCLDTSAASDDWFEYLDIGVVIDRRYYDGYVVVKSMTNDQYYFALTKHLIPLLGKPT